MIHHGHVYVVFDIDFGRGCEAYHIPKINLPYGDHANCPASLSSPVRPIGGMFAEREEHWASAGRKWAVSMYGVSSVEIFDHFLDFSSMAPITTNSGLRFHTHTFSEDPSSPLVPGDAVTLMLPQSINQHGSTILASSYSGLNVVVVLSRLEDPNSYDAILVRYHPGPGSTASHVLTIPSSLRLHECCGIAIDDYLGHIAILCEGGELYCLTYA
jgi:hypothetical protein